VEFSVGILGIFDVEGRFPRFEGDLLLDLDRPERSRVDVAIDAGVVERSVKNLGRAACLSRADRPG
jgi:polyisoprenoid-binding protein YceI